MGKVLVNCAKTKVLTNCDKTKVLVKCNPDPCTGCDNKLKDTYSLNISGLIGNCAEFNGSYTVTRDGRSCWWRGSAWGGGIGISPYGVGSVSAFFFNPGNFTTCPRHQFNFFNYRKAVRDPCAMVGAWIDGLGSPPECVNVFNEACDSTTTTVYPIVTVT